VRFLLKAAAVVGIVAALLPLAGCKKKLPPGSQVGSSATTEGAALNGVDAGLVPVPMSPIGVAPAGATAGKPSAPSASIAVITPGSLPDSMSAADRAAFTKTKELVADLEGLVKKSALTHADRPDEPDATTKCASNEDARKKLALAADPEAKKVAIEAERLCSLDVPVISADKALKQLAGSSSQASHLLMCGLAKKDIDRARATKASDRRVRDLDARFAQACR